VNEVSTEVLGFESRASAIGLRLNHAKCEVIGLSRESRAAWLSTGLSFLLREPEEASLLGAPLHVQLIDKAIEEKCEALQRAMVRLKHMSAHEAIFILRNSLSVPRLQYILRCAPCFGSPLTARFDDLVLQALSSCANIELDSSARVQAQLPVRWGGLGLRSATQLAPSAFLSSLAAAETLMRAMLPAPLLTTPDPFHDAALSSWRALGGGTPPAVETAGSREAGTIRSAPASTTPSSQPPQDLPAVPGCWRSRLKGLAPGSRLSRPAHSGFDWEMTKCASRWACAWESPSSGPTRVAAANQSRQTDITASLAGGARDAT